MAGPISTEMIFRKEEAGSVPLMQWTGVQRWDMAASRLVEIPPEGHPVLFSWVPMPGATGAEVLAAGLRIAPAWSEKAVGELKVTESSGHLIVATGNRRIRALTLKGVKYLPEGADPIPIGSAAQLPTNFRLVVTVPDGRGGWLPPLHSVPPVPARGMLPPSLTGASFDNGVLQVPDLLAPEMRITLAEGSFPEGFQVRNMTLESVVATEAVLPEDLQILSPDGSTAWAFPGELPPQTPPVEIDLRLPVQTAFTAACREGQTPAALFTIKGRGTIAIGITEPRGALLRAFPGIIRTVLQGEPASMGLGEALPPERPSSVTGDLTVTYDGIRVVEHLSDKVPIQAGNLSGIIVSAEWAARVFPPRALEGLKLARVGVVGRSPLDTDLELRFVDAVSGEPLGPSTGVHISPSPEVKAHWAILGDHPPLSHPAHLAVKATKGRFYWVADPHPLVRVAILDPTYPDKRLRMDGTSVSLAGASSNPLHIPGWLAPLEPFRASPPVLDSDLFLTVDFSDPVLRYAR